MIIKNTLDRTFGPFGSSTGFFMLLGGILVSYFSLYGLIIVIAGAFTALTYTSTFIDTGKKKVKHTDILFGIIPTGKWIDITPDMKLGLAKSHRGFRAYTRGTQPYSIHYNDIRIMLFDSGNKKIMPLQKCTPGQSPEDELIKMSGLLGLDRFK